MPITRFCFVRCTMSFFEKLELTLTIGVLVLGIRGFMEPRTWEEMNEDVNRIVRSDDPEALVMLKAFLEGYLVGWGKAILNGFDSTCEDVKKLARKFQNA
jgi:hypothetical protein